MGTLLPAAAMTRALFPQSEAALLAVLVPSAAKLSPRGALAPPAASLTPALFPVRETAFPAGRVLQAAQLGVLLPQAVQAALLVPAEVFLSLPPGPCQLIP